jgi:UDP-3-O-[3-hydroxymyristoyl] glucosamine N-acyltransferase
MNSRLNLRDILALRLTLPVREKGFTMKISLGELSERFGGTISGNPDVLIQGVNALDIAAQGEITFAEQTRYTEQVISSHADALVVPEDFPDIPEKNLLRVAKPRQVFIHIVKLFHPEPVYPQGIHPSAVVAEDIQLDKGVHITECAVVREGVHIGQDTIIESGAHIGRNVVLGKECRIGPNVVLMDEVRLGDRVRIHAGTVIGGEGFGYLWVGDHHMKVPQIGSVQIDDDVEIGCNVCIDRATFGVTRIRRGTKIDNLVQIGHNNDIGEDTIIVSQVGLSGSVKVGRRVILAGKVGTTDHITIGDGAVVGGATAVTKDIKAGESVWGYPSRPMHKVLRELASLARLPRLIQQVKDLRSRLSGMENRLDNLEKRKDSGTAD